MTRILFESLWLLSFFWIAVQAAFIVVWSRRRDRLTARIAWGGFASLPLLILLSIIIVTPRERIIRLCKDLAGYVNDGDVPAIAHRLAEDFVAGRLDNDEFVTHVERVLTRYRVDDPVLRRFTVTFPKRGTGVAEFHASAKIRSSDLLYESFTSRWRLTCRREDGEWKVVQLESIPVPPLNIGDIHRWFE